MVCSLSKCCMFSLLHVVSSQEYRKALMQKQQEQQTWEMERGLRRDSSMEASLMLQLP